MVRAIFTVRLGGAWHSRMGCLAVRKRAGPVVCAGSASVCVVAECLGEGGSLRGPFRPWVMFPRGRRKVNRFCDLRFLLG